MKKVLSLVLVTILVAGLALTGFAAYKAPAKHDDYSLNEYQKGILRDLNRGVREIEQKPAHRVIKGDETNGKKADAATVVEEAKTVKAEKVEKVVEVKEVAPRTTKAPKTNVDITDWQQGILEDLLAGRRQLGQKPAHNVTKAD